MSATATGTATATTHQYFRGTFSSLATTSSYASALNTADARTEAVLPLIIAKRREKRSDGQGLR